MAPCRALKRFRQQNPDNPLAVDYVLDAVIFRELYRLDLLDTTFYAHDGFLNGKHAVAADPAVADRVNSLYTKAIELSDQQLEQESGGRRRALCARLGAQPARGLHRFDATKLCFRPPCCFAGAQ